MSETSYIPNPLATCTSPTPCPDPCATQAYILKRQTQPIVCLPDSGSILADLLIYWKMEENNITRQDSHTGNHDGSVVGTVPSSASGKILNAAEFDGDAGDYLENIDAVLAITVPYTIVFWINFDDVGSSAFVLGRYDDTGSIATSTGYRVGMHQGRMWMAQADGTAAGSVFFHPATIGSLVTATWYFVVMGWTGTEFFAQIDNGARRTQATTAIAAASSSFRVGGLQGSNVGFQGRIDELAIWYNRVLTPAEVTYLYNSGAGRTYPFA